MVGFDAAARSTIVEMNALWLRGAHPSPMITGDVMTIPSVSLNDGNTLPAVGFGTVSLRGEDCYTAMGNALESGYRLLDTAVNLENEVDDGEPDRRPRLSLNSVQTVQT